MKRFPHAIWIVALLVVMAVAGFFTLFERKDVMVPVPPRGAAATNRFYALEQVLRRMGHTPVSVTSIPSSGRIDSILVGANPALIDEATSDRLLAWVASGGILIMPTGNESDMTHAAFWQRLRAKVAVAPRPYGCASFAGEPGDKPLSICGSRVRVPPDARLSGLGDDKGDVLASVALGKGEVLLLASLDAFSRRGLEQPLAQRLASRLFALDTPAQDIVLVYRLDGPRVWAAMVKQGWPALLAATLLIMGWAAARAMRLGPVITTPPPDRRALLEHVQAAGEYLYGRDQGRQLHRRLCAGILARARRQDPGADELEGEALYARLAERHGIAPADLARAFQTPTDANAFRDSVATLARLRRHP